MRLASLLVGPQAAADIVSQTSYPMIEADDFIQVDKLWLWDSKGTPYFVQGMNYWSCMNLGADEQVGGDLLRLKIELDQLAAVGVNHIRVMAATEGAEHREPFRILPALQHLPGQTDERIFRGLDRCVAEASKRGIRLTMVMGNTWQWTGGNAQLYAWAEGIKEIPYPRSWNLSLGPQRNDGYVGWGNWSIDSGGFEDFQGRFYTSLKAQDIYQEHLDKVLNRINSVTGRVYKEDATIMTWEPINEPQLTPDENGGDAMIAWHNKIARHIKTVAPKQLVTTGFEAKQGLQAYVDLHKGPHVDYGCAHMWPQIWGHYDMLDPRKGNVETAKRWTSEYILEVEGYSREVGKPMLLEEFGMPRDNWMNNVAPGKYLYDTSATTTSRDAVFSSVYELVASQFKARKGLIGLMPWSYGGTYRSAKQKYNNQGILIAGDPPQEPPGWFSILDTDNVMQTIAKTHDKVTKFIRAYRSSSSSSSSSTHHTQLHKREEPIVHYSTCTHQ
ncbi:hypothetical protein CBS101457_006660 [Exobasidium rhododendri]|nr:hypothetical protein CBS101457_006660 [Exobasidium rhododendri]